MKNWIVTVVLLASLGIATSALAHEGHMHKALGTVVSVQGEKLELKTTDGKPLTLVVDKTTAITRGKDKIEATALKAGDRVSVEYMEANKILKVRDLNDGFTNPELISLAYFEASLLVEHLAATYGEPAIHTLLRAYGKGLETDAALKEAFNATAGGHWVVPGRGRNPSSTAWGLLWPEARRNETQTSQRSPSEGRLRTAASTIGINRWARAFSMGLWGARELRASGWRNVSEDRVSSQAPSV